MGLALALAEKARGWTSPNPMVGAVVVNAGRIVGQGFHRRAGGPHAEVEAIDNAGPAACGATLYVTLEPCNHYGRTPPCTEKILAAGIARVVAAMADPNPHVAGSGNAFLKSRGIAVTERVCEDRARRLNEAFVKHVTTGRPFVIAKCAATLDGRIAAASGDARWVTGPAARQYVHGLRHGADAILVGVDTVIRDDPALTTRLEGTAGKDPARLILDSRLRIPLTSQVLSLDSPATTFIICGPSCPVEKRRALEDTGAKVLDAALGTDGRIDLAPLCDQLGRMGITSVLIEGGSRVLGSVLRSGIADKLCFFLAPKVMAGDDGFPVCRGQGAATMAEALCLRDTAVRRFGDDVLIEGYVKR